MKIRFIVLLATLLFPAFVQSAEQVAPSPTAVKRIGVEEYDKLRAINLDIDAKAGKLIEK